MGGCAYSGACPSRWVASGWALAMQCMKCSESSIRCACCSAKAAAYEFNRTLNIELFFYRPALSLQADYAALGAAGGASTIRTHVLALSVVPPFGRHNEHSVPYFKPHSRSRFSWAAAQFLGGSAGLLLPEIAVVRL